MPHLSAPVYAETPLLSLRGFLCASNVADSANDIDITGRIGDALVSKGSLGGIVLNQDNIVTVQKDRVQTVSELNGRDQATLFVVDTWIYIHLVWDEKGTWGGLLSTSATTPTLPANYRFFRRIGSARIGAGGDFLPFHQVTYLSTRRTILDLSEANAKVLANGDSGGIATFVAVDISTHVPPTVSEIFLAGFNTGNLRNCYLRLSECSDMQIPWQWGTCNCEISWYPTACQTFHYASSSSCVDAMIFGYGENA